jgi:Ca2+-dependent lipid-binding protein
MDFLSKSDPFCRVHCGTEQRQTRVIKNNLNPKWADTFAFQHVEDRAGKGGTLEIDVYDYNRFSKPDFIGRFLLSLDDVAANTAYDDWFQLAPRDSKKLKKGKTLGEVHLRITLDVPKKAEDKPALTSGGSSGVWVSKKPKRKDNKTDDRFAACFLLKRDDFLSPLTFFFLILFPLNTCAVI